MADTELENILLAFGNRLLDVANGRENPTLGELIDTPRNEIKALIAKEREQAAADARIDELERIDAANKDNGINFWFKDLKIEGSLENNNGWRTISQYVPERLAKLQSTQSGGLKRLGEEN